MKPSPYLLVVFSGLASQKWMCSSTTKYFSPSFSYKRSPLPFGYAAPQQDVPPDYACTGKDELLSRPLKVARILEPILSFPRVENPHNYRVPPEPAARTPRPFPQCKKNAGP